MILKFLGNAKLQSLIGADLLDRLEPMLPIITHGDKGDMDLYSIQNLAQIYSSFIGPSFFKKKANRSMLLNVVPEDLINDLCLTVGIDTTLSFRDKVDKIIGKGWNDSEFCRRFLDWSGLPDSLVPNGEASRDPVEIIDKAESPYKVLKNYQYEVFQTAREELVPNLSRLVIQMPTGSGKTRTAMEILTDFINTREDETVIVWIAHSEELCEQSLQCFKDVWRHVGKNPISIFRCWGGLSDLPLTFEGSALIVASFQTLNSILTKSKVAFQALRDRISVIVVDEAHKVIAPTYERATKALIGNQTRVIGLTATPGRAEDAIEENKDLSEFFFQHIVSITPPNNESVISYLKREKVLARMHSEPLITGQSYDLSESELRYLESHFDYPKGFLSRIGEDDVRNVEIIKRLDHECSLGSQILFFACSVEHSKFVASLLQYLGYSASHIDGDSDKEFRRQAIADFKDRRSQVICNYGVLSTGFDAPKMDVVFISRPTKSIVLYSQMIGRGLRGPAIGGTESCKLIDVRDNILGFSDSDYIYTYFDDYWTN